MRSDTRKTLRWSCLLVTLRCLGMSAFLDSSNGQQDGSKSLIEHNIMLGMQLGIEGQHDAAYTRFKEAFDAASRNEGNAQNVFNATSLNNFGLAAHRSGRQGEALDLFRLACGADTSFCSELSIMLKQAGLFAEAKAVLSGAVARSTTDPNLWLSAGLTLLAAGEYIAAVRAFTIARRIDPGNAKLLVNEGQALIQAGAKEEGRQRLLLATLRAPGDAKPHLMLVDLYSGWDQPANVAKHLNLALHASPQDPAALEAYATLMTRIGQYGQALGMRRKMVRTRPDDFLQRCKLVQLAQSVAAWDAYEEHISAILDHLRAHPPQARDCLQPLETTINSAYSEADLQWVTRLWADELIWTVPGALAVSQELGGLPEDAGGLQESGRLRVGYLSSNLQAGAVFLMIQGLWRAHREHVGRHVARRGRVEVLTFSNVPLDSANAASESFSELHNYTAVTTLPYPADRVASARAVREAGLQVLVNINGWCDQGANELLASRLAPLQVSMMGYPGSMGSAKWTDLLVSDATASPPEFEAHFTEKLLLLPETYYVNDFQFRLPHVGRWKGRGDSQESRRGHSLPEDAFVFASFNRPEKIDRAIFASWMRILLGAPVAVLWLLRDVKGRSAAAQGGANLVEELLRAAAAAAGVDPARIVFASPEPWRRHVARSALADLFLDTPPYNAHSTGCNSLWAGVPILTYSGVKMASRVAAGMNRAAGLSAYTARTMQEYEDIAVALATRALRAEALRRELTAERHRRWLFDTEGMVAVLERGFGMAWEVWHATGHHAHVIPSR